MPIMEDYRISEDLSANGYKITVIDSSVTTSTRRYKGHVKKLCGKCKNIKKCIVVVYL